MLFIETLRSMSTSDFADQGVAVVVSIFHRIADCVFFLCHKVGEHLAIGFIIEQGARRTDVLHLSSVTELPGAALMLLAATLIAIGLGAGEQRWFAHRSTTFK